MKDNIVMTVTEFRADLREALTHVSDGGIVVITNRGRPVAVLTPPRICVTDKSGVLFDGTDGYINVDLKVEQGETNE